MVSDRAVKLAVEFRKRNLPFVRYVAFMGMEYTGFTIKNHDLVWIDPLDYKDQLETAVCELNRWGLNVSVFNLTHCVLNENLWKFAVKSISDSVSYTHLTLPTNSLV